MRVYLNGIEYKSYRGIMQSLGVRFGCLNYEYIWTRTPRFSIEEECEFLESLIIYPGNLDSRYMTDYIDYINNYAEHFDFAIEMYTKDREMLDEDCAVPITPLYYTGTTSPIVAVTESQLAKPFMKTRLQKLKDCDTIIHGISCDSGPFSSINSSTWMRGKSGTVSYFDDRSKKLLTYKNNSVSSLARKLVLEGYDIDLNLVKRLDWKEVAKINCIAWFKYQNHMEV